MANKEKCVVIFLDLAEVFDFLEHNRLLNKIENLNIRNVSLGSIKSIMIESKETKGMSDYDDIKYGVPQGTVLGPTLFLVHINDLIKITTESSLT